MYRWVSPKRTVTGQTTPLCRGAACRVCVSSLVTACEPGEFQKPFRRTIISHGTPDDWLIMGRQHSLPRQDNNAIKRSFILLLAVHYFSILMPCTKTVTVGLRACQSGIQISFGAAINLSTFSFFIFVHLFIYFILAALCLAMTRHHHWSLFS